MFFPSQVADGALQGTLLDNFGQTIDKFGLQIIQPCGSARSTHRRNFRGSMTARA
jgi:hypothetical protein